MTRVIRLIVAVLGAAVGLAAQTPSGAVVGRAADKAGIPFPGVAVTLGGASIAQPRTAVTDAGGDYAFPAVPDGTYHLTFQPLGFCTVIQDDVVVAAGARVRANAAITDSASHLRCPGDTGALVVRIETAFGNIDVALDATHAPITVINFLKYVDGHFYDGGQFHRATRPDNYTPAPPNRPMMEIIQGGIDPARRRDGFPPIPLERTSVTGLKHLTGAVSMARGTAADTATSDFFILLDDQPSLDFGGKRFDDGQGGAAFGQVVEGLDVVRKIQQQPVQGQNLTPPIAMTRAYRLPPSGGGSPPSTTPAVLMLASYVQASTGTLQGNVTAAGRPLPAAGVIIDALPPENPWSRDPARPSRVAPLFTRLVTADRSGHYECTSLPVGRYEVTFTLAGFLPVKHRVTNDIDRTTEQSAVLRVGGNPEWPAAIGDGPESDDLRRTLPWALGFVTWGSARLTDATVTIVPAGDAGAGGQWTTMVSSWGTFELRGFPEGDYSVSVERPGSMPMTKPRVAMKQIVTLEFELKPAASTNPRDLAAVLRRLVQVRTLRRGR